MNERTVTRTDGEEPAQKFADARTSWNELQFLSWGEFKQMAPSILQLEVTRIGALIGTFPESNEFHNGLVRARFALKRFIACLGHAEKDTVEESCAQHIRTAIMNMSLQPDNLDIQTRETCSYILNRLHYALHRIRLIY